MFKNIHFMITYIYSILTSVGTNVFTLQNLVFIAIIALIYMLYKKDGRFKLGAEGFTQRDHFVFKQGVDAYDDFYCNVYDTLAKTVPRSEWELMQVLKMTEPTTNNSLFLDVGCGCGYKVEQLRLAGFKAYGLELSSAVRQYALETHPNIEIVLGDVLEPMIFDKSIFSHILCTQFTIYELENKMIFFRNCYSWLIPNGYLVLHLVDPERFDAVIPVTKNRWRQKDQRTRLADTLVDFHDFNYHAHYDFSKRTIHDPRVEFVETFTDKGTGKVRKNEQIMYMESINDILKMASQCGFIFHGKMDMKDCPSKDENQYLFILEKI
jgi:SAM-dependent methyltransferase